MSLFHPLMTVRWAVYKAKVCRGSSLWSPRHIMHHSCHSKKNLLSRSLIWSSLIIIPRLCQRENYVIVRIAMHLIGKCGRNLGYHAPDTTWLASVDVTLTLAPVTKAVPRDLRQISHMTICLTHDCVLGISVNIPTKVFYPLMCFLFVYSESCFYTFGRIDWVGWRWARGDDGRGWSTRGPQEIPHFSYKISVI